MSKKSSLLLYLIVLLGLFFRLYKFPQTLNMDTDQGVAYLLADRIINYGHILLVGPFTSLWQVNILPPTYYYFVTILYYLLRNELAVSLAFTFVASLSIIFIYFLGREMFDSKTGLITALLYAISETMVWYGRNIWEPHLVPFFIILSLLFLFKAKRLSKMIYLHLSLLFFFMSFLYISSILLLPIYFYLFTRIYKSIKSSEKFLLIKPLLLFLFYGGLIYLPVIIFESIHGYPSLIYLWQVIQGKTDYITYENSSYLSSLTSHIFLFIRSIFIYINSAYATIIFIVFISIVLYFIFVYKQHRLNLIILISLIISAFLFTGFYSQKTEVYRLASLYPILFLLSGSLTSKAFKSKSRQFKLLYLSRAIIIFGLSAFIFLNIKSLFYSLINLKMRKYTQPYEIAVQILNSAEGKDFTLYTITPDDHDNHHSTSYWWALEKLTGKRLVSLNDRGNWIKQDLDADFKNIFLICRDFTNENDLRKYCLDYFSKLNLLENPAKEYKIDNVTIYKFKNSLPF